jgi:hypothetical protein
MKMSHKTISKNVQEAINEILQSVGAFEEAQIKCAKKLEKMTDEERTEFVELMTEAAPKYNKVWEAMAVAAKKRIPEARHIYTRADKYPMSKIKKATVTALKTIENPKAVVPVVKHDGSVVNKTVESLNNREVQDIWDTKTGIVSVRTQRRRIEAKKKKELVKDTCKISSAVAEKDHILVTVQGYANPLKLTKKEVKMLYEMMF